MKKIPFGAQFEEVVDDSPIPPTKTWDWQPSPTARKELIEASTPSRTCTGNCSDEREEEFGIKPRQ